MVFMLPGPVERALDRLHAAGFSAYVVGGCVRDWVLGVAPHDYDICTAALPEDMQRIFQGERTIETGLRHGTLTVLLDGMPLEITTFRLDGEYLDGRHPASVRFTGRVEDDLSRRDFTINAMAYAPAAGLVDPFGGREDCRRGVIRCVGEAEKRFAEDALRILRALRFSARLRFPIAPETDAALRAGRTQLERISRERIAAELTGLLLGDGAGGVLMAYPEVIRTVLPELSALTAGPAWARTLRRIDAAPKEESLRWAAFLMDAGADGPSCARLARDTLRGLKMSGKMMDGVSALALWRDAEPRIEDMQEMLMRLGPEKLDQWIRLKEADRIAQGVPRAEAQAEADARRAETQRLLRENACYTLAQLAVNGSDLAKLGFSGMAIGQTLERLLGQVVRRELENRRDALLAAARETPEAARCPDSAKKCPKRHPPANESASTFPEPGCKK